jgi:hypothetical protein
VIEAGTLLSGSHDASFRAARIEAAIRIARFLPSSTESSVAFSCFVRYDALRFLFVLTSIFSGANNLEKSCPGRRQEAGMNTEYGWINLYKAAILETDWRKIEERIQVAEDGLKGRLHEFSMNHGGTPEENQAIADALHGLDILRNEVVAWQGSKRAG